ncbi:MAG: type II secretion system F family protein [Roseburia sp.]|nr:type II secretion system F family protein [Roseburia sp.]
MFINAQDIVIMGIGCALLLFWIALLLSSKKYYTLFDNLDEKEFPLKQLYSTGYAVLEGIKYKYKSKLDRKLRADLTILYEEKYAEYYLRVAYSQSITIAFLVAILGFILYGLSREIMILMICILMSGLSVYYFLTLSSKKIQKRSEELLRDFSEVVSKLALLTNAGLIMREAWFQVAYGGERTIYQEMQRACDDMDNGISEIEAVRRFGVRCIIPEVKKFSATVIQGIEKGNRELAVMLTGQSDELWTMQQQRVKREAAQANTKLMIPMFIMFAGVLIMIIIPIFTNLGV